MCQIFYSKTSYVATPVLRVAQNGQFSRCLGGWALGGWVVFSIRFFTGRLKRYASTGFATILNKTAQEDY